MKIIGTCLLYKHGVYQVSAVALHEASGRLFAGMTSKQPTRYLGMGSGGNTTGMGWQWQELVLDDGATYTANELGRLVLA